MTFMLQSFEPNPQRPSARGKPALMTFMPQSFELAPPQLETG
jgi:hypothetical protein